jgi:hypothetical protein
MKHNEHPLYEEVLSRIAVMNIRDSFEAHNGIDVMFGTRPPMKSIHRLKNLSRTKHFGNPFRTDRIANDMNKRYSSNYKGYGTATDASELFVEWIRGEVHQDIEPERCTWLYETINNTDYRGVKFTYYRKCDQETSHIFEMLKYIISIERQKDFKGEVSMIHDLDEKDII